MTAGSNFDSYQIGLAKSTAPDRLYIIGLQVGSKSQHYDLLVLNSYSVGTKFWHYTYFLSVSKSHLVGIKIRHGGTMICSCQIHTQSAPSFGTTLLVPKTHSVGTKFWRYAACAKNILSRHQILALHSIFVRAKITQSAPNFGTAKYTSSRH